MPIYQQRDIGSFRRVNFFFHIFQAMKLPIKAYKLQAHVF